MSGDPVRHLHILVNQYGYCNLFMYNLNIIHHAVLGSVPKTFPGYMVIMFHQVYGQSFPGPSLTMETEGQSSSVTASCSEGPL